MTAARSSCCSLPAVTARIYASDEVAVFLVPAVALVRPRPVVRERVPVLLRRGIAATPGFHETFLERTTETGRRINFGTIGCAILWAPFYAAGDVVARALHAAGATSRSTATRGRTSRRWLWVGAATASCAAASLAIARRLGAVARRLRRLSGAGGAAGVARHAAALLHVRRAADVARDVGLRGGAFLLCWLRVRDTGACAAWRCSARSPP